MAGHRSGRRTGTRPAAFVTLLLLLVISGFTGAAGCTAPDATPTDVASSAPTEPIELPDTGVELGDAQKADASADPTPEAQAAPEVSPPSAQPFDLAQVPAFSGTPYAQVAGGVPSLSVEEADSIPAESYAPLDALGRCGTAMAVVSRATMPTGERGSIGMIKPTGWHTVRYDDLVDGRYLYNRCHLIGWQLAAENANDRNLVTGTRYMNVEGMLPFENDIADYVEATGNRVMLRVTPVFQGDELVCRGVHMEALSVEDGGAGISFNVFCYNVQPGIAIDYATGDSWRESAPAEPDAPAASTETTYILNTNTDKFHLPGCSAVDRMAEHNKREVTDSREDVIAQGFEPCGLCNP